MGVKQYWDAENQKDWRREIRFLAEIGSLVLLLLLWLTWPRPLQAQGTNSINEPVSGDTIGGVVIIEGTATDADFLRYELAFLQEANSGAGWIVFAEGDRPVVNGTLAIWDTTVGRGANAPVFPDGAYQLRLRVVRTDYNYNEYFVRSLLLTNDQPTPTPTITETVTAVTATPRQTPAAEFVAPTPALLPSLTPFPTPTRPPVPQDRGTIVAGQTDATVTGDQTEARPGLQGRLAALETSSLGRAFWQGVVLTFYLFVALFLYLPLRALLRRSRRLLLKLWYRR
jgi:hypothetical protein